MLVGNSQSSGGRSALTWSAKTTKPKTGNWVPIKYEFSTIPSSMSLATNKNKEKKKQQELLTTRQLPGGTYYSSPNHPRRIWPFPLVRAGFCDNRCWNPWIPCLLQAIPLPRLHLVHKLLQYIDSGRQILFQYLFTIIYYLFILFQRKHVRVP